MVTADEFMENIRKREEAPQYNVEITKVAAWFKDLMNDGVIDKWQIIAEPWLHRKDVKYSVGVRKGENVCSIDFRDHNTETTDEQMDEFIIKCEKQGLDLLETPQ